MTTALITNYRKNSDGGGIKTYLANLIDALQNKGADVSGLFREGDDPEHFRDGRNKVAFSLVCYRQLQEVCPRWSVPRVRGTISSLACSTRNSIGAC